MSDTPDFDSMSPEEMMEWMESLAKRQGAAEGFTTEASIEIEEVDASDERLADMGEYKPYGMSDADWEKMQEREAAEKAERLAAQQSAPEPAPPPPAPEPEVVPEPIAEAEPVAASAEGDTPDFDSMSPEEMMEWMESLAKRQGAAEGFTTSASMEVAEVDASDERLADMGEYKPYGMSDADWEKMQEREAAEKADRLAAQQSAPEPVAEYEYEDVEEYVDDEEFFEAAEDSEELVMAHLDNLEDTQEDEPLPDFDDLLPTEPVAEVDSPMEWLEGLSAGDEDNAMPELDFGALGDLGALGETEDAGDPMAWLASLSGDEDNGAPDLSAMMADGGDEGSLEWMESLAADQGADSEELVTDANLDIPMPENFSEDSPGYEEFSFENATGVVQEGASPAGANADVPEMNLENPESWLDSLASGVGTEIPDDIFSGADNELPDEDDYDEEFVAGAEDEPEFENLADNVKAQMDSGNLGDNPEDINKFFQSAFAKAETRDVPDYIDSEDEEVDIEDVEMPVQAEIPDWLQESMSAAPAESNEVEIPVAEQKTATAEMMIADLGLEAEDEQAEIPDWLAGGIDEDSGVIADDIFDEAVIEEAEAATASVIDTQDTWVDAFSKENSEELETWYESAVADIDGGDGAAVNAQAASADAISLQVADLPVESKLAEGSAQAVPDWLGGDKSGKSVEVEAARDDDMDWLEDDYEEEAVLTADDSNMPDWLQATVDDSITADEDLPDWLAGETDIAAEEIPDWLRETMDEEEALIDSPFATELLEEDVEPTPASASVPAPPPLPVPVQQSPAPVPVAAGNVDAVAFLRSAKEKIAARDIEGAMLDYEQVVRANKALAQVEKELQRLVEDNSYKKNPSINRVLGDVLMRQGKLQEALNTYRKALNML